MEPLLLPQPQSIRMGDGAFTVPRRGTIAIADPSLAPAARALSATLGNWSVAAPLRDEDPIQLRLDRSLRREGYRLRIGRDGVVIEGHAPDAVLHALRTLRQIAAQSPATRWPALTIEDHPDFERRSIYYDMCRGRVPRREALLAQAAGLADFKINELQYYIKHTFRFRGHPLIGKGCSPLTAEDLLAVDAACLEHGIDFVPSIASFGHMDRILEHAPYRHLAEDYGEHRYHQQAEALRMPPKAWTLAPANPEGYAFLESLWDEFLPLFASRRFNVCCDETWDLCWGQSYELGRRKGRGRVYLDHILKLRDMAARHGKRIMFWGDIIRQYPELIPDIPGDVIALDWQYDPNHNFETIRDFRDAGVAFYGCSGTSGWCRIFPPLHGAKRNIAGFARAGHKYGAMGNMVTDWGDGGHYNFMENSWYGYLFGAEQGWNTRADQSTFTRRFCRLFLGSDADDLVDAVDTIGEIGHYAAQTIFFAAPDEPVLAEGSSIHYFDRDGEGVEFTLTNKVGDEVSARLAEVIKTFARYSGKRGLDPHGVLPYWEFAAQALDHAAHKVQAFGPGGHANAATRRKLKHEMEALLDRFVELWHARNHKSEIGVTLARYRRAIKALGG